jgi:hypothetical protein
MGILVVASVNKTRRPTNHRHAPVPAAGRNPTMNATTSTRTEENRFESVDDMPPTASG